MNQYCIKCGKELVDGAIFCDRCGFKVVQNTMDSSASPNYNSTSNWYFMDEMNIKRGPFHSTQINNLIATGSIKRGTQLLKEGEDFWKQADMTEFAGMFFNTAMSAKYGNIKNTYAYLLAVVPQAASIVLGLAGYASMGLIIAITLNIVFAALDISYLRKCNIVMENWIWLGLFIIPVYLFVRSSKVDNNYGYSVTWCIMFLLNIFI